MREASHQKGPNPGDPRRQRKNEDFLQRRAGCQQGTDAAFQNHASSLKDDGEDSTMLMPGESEYRRLIWCDSDKCSDGPILKG